MAGSRSGRGSEPPLRSLAVAKHTFRIQYGERSGANQDIVKIILGREDADHAAVGGSRDRAGLGAQPEELSVACAG